MPAHASADPAAPRFVVTGRIPDEALELLAAHGSLWVSPHDRPLARGELHDAARGADAVVSLLHDRVDDALCAAAGPSLKVVANVAVGYNNMDLAALARRGVVATNTPGVLTEATADIALALLLMVTRRLGEGERIIRSGQRWQWSMHFLLGTSVAGRQLGIVGLGAIGQATARRARALGMHIAYSSRNGAAPEVEAELGAVRMDLDRLIETSDVVSLHCPYSAATHHLIDATRLAHFQPSAFLVNTARGPVVDEAALVAALRAGTLAGAGLDVYEHEPAVHPGLVELDNVALLPHLGSATVETRTAMAVLAARNAIAVATGQPALTPIPVPV